MKRHRWKNKGGTTTELSVPLALARRPASRIGRNHWHARKRQQTILVWKNNDFDSLILLGAANRERIERAQEKGMPTIHKGPRFDKINPWHKEG